MKKRYLLVFAMIGIAGIAGAADATNTPPAGPVTTNAPVGANATAEAAPVADTDNKVQQSPEAKPEGTLGTNMLMLNFRGASLDQVLSYFSEAAGFVINVKPGTSVRGKVDVWSNDPITKDEAVNLLDTVLNQNNLAAIRHGRTFTIVNKDEAKTQNIPVIQGGDPATIPSLTRL